MSAHVASSDVAATSRRCLGLIFAVAALLTASTVGVSMVPGLRFQGWPWVLVGVAGMTVVLAAPLHTATAAELRAVRPGPASLGTLGLVIALAATVVETLSERTPTMAVAVVASAGLLSLVVHWRGEESVTEVPTGVVVGVAVAAIVTGGAWAVVDTPLRGLLVAAAVLVAAGPAALLAAGPAALHAARRRVARHDVTLPHPAALGRVAAADLALLDKDGTVTTGSLRVLAVEPVEPDHDRNLRWFAGALAHERDDRTARAVARLSARGRVTEVRTDGHAGTVGRVDRHPVRVGDLAWLGLPPRPGTWATLGVEVDGRVLGTLTVGDEVRPDAADGVQALRDLGLDVALRSADTDARTLDVGHQVGIDDVRGDVDLAEQRADVETREREGQHVLHVSPGTTLADDLGLGDLDVRRVARAVDAARRAVTSARRAGRVAVAWNVVVGVVGATGLLGPGLASLAAGCGVAVTMLAARS